MKTGIVATIICGLAIAGVCIGLLLYCDRREDPVEPGGRYQTDEARIKSIHQMVSLCTLEIDEEMVFKDSINGKWVVARERIRGSIRYDLEKLRIDRQGDTLFVRLPEETIEIREDEAPDSYEILDYWDGDHTLFNRAMTAREENLLKRRWSSQIEKRIRERGYLGKARIEAMNTLVPLFNALRATDCVGGEIVLIEPATSPQGVAEPENPHFLLDPHYP